jgi:hypothetical protein
MRRLDPRSPPELDLQIVDEWRRGGVRFSEGEAARLLDEWRRGERRRGDGRPR